jgi:hypothetical protein
MYWTGTSVVDIGMFFRNVTLALNKTCLYMVSFSPVVMGKIFERMLWFLSWDLFLLLDTGSKNRGPLVNGVTVFLFLTTLIPVCLLPLSVEQKR